MNRHTAAMLACAATVGVMAAAPAGAVPGGNTNSASYWSDQLGMTCTESYDGVGAMSWTVDQDYGAVLVKGGSVPGYLGAPGVAAYIPAYDGDVVMAPLNNGGQQAAISWIITCDPGYYYGS